MNTFDTIIMLGGAFLALCTFSYPFFGETYFFALSESVLIGGGIALGVFAIIRSLQSSMIDPLMIIPLIIGLTAFARWTKYRWIARYPVAILSGVGLGVTAGSTIRGQVVAAVIEVIRQLKVADPDFASAVLALIGVCTILFYFMYSRQYSDIVHQGSLKFLGRLGRLFLFCGFGYLYASTFMAEGIDALSAQIIPIFLRTIRALQGVYG